MARKIFDVTLTAAAIQAVAPNVYVWVDRFGNLLSSGQAALIGTVAAVGPPDTAVLDVSSDQGVELFVSHGVLTGGVGGKVSVAEVAPDYPATGAAGAPVVFGAATVDQALAATAESVKTAVMATAPAVRLVKIAVALLWTTTPSAATPMRIQLWAHRDGQMPAVG